MSKASVWPKAVGGRTRVVVTTPWSQTPESWLLAGELSEWFGCERVLRNARSIVKVCEDEGVDACLIADKVPKLYHSFAPDKALYFHPGMAMQRLLNLRRGQPDRLLTAAGVKSGDTIVDATLGLGTDALILAAGAGPAGRVESVENSEPLAKLFSYAIHTSREQTEWIQPLLERIHVHLMDHVSFLKCLETDSVDIVYFDPMFRDRTRQPSNADALRQYADPRELSKKTMREAVRAARRCVVVKERVSSGVFERFGLEPDKRRTRFSYGVLHVR